MSQPPQGPPRHGPDGRPSWPDQPDQGGWGATLAPGYGGRPTQVGGFGPGQPGGPGWGAPAGAPGGGGGHKKHVAITLVAVFVLVLAAGVVLALSIGGGDDPQTAGDGPRTSPVPTPTSGSSSSAPPGSSPSGGSSPAPPGTVAPADLIAHLPADFTDCAVDQPAGDGDLAAATCGAASTQPGPAEAHFFRYPDVPTLDSVFAADVSDEGLTEFVGDADCSTATGYGSWTYTDGTPGGKVGCQISDDGSVLVVWTDDSFLTEGAVRAPGSTQAEVSALYDWWTAHSEYQG
jgi:hypothetical protein